MADDKSAAPPAAAANNPYTQTHTVVPGDTLSKIAQKAYGDPSQWNKIYQANKAIIGPNPNLIKAGQKLVIP
jgi:nucleoid-associated protein YgaU